MERHAILSSSDSRAYSAYHQHADLCPDILPTNRFPFLIASKYYHNAQLTGTLPARWDVIWYAPTENDVAILDIHVIDSYVINVFVGSQSSDSSFTIVPKSFATPTLADVAGAHLFNPQQRNLTVVLRGGINNHYKFVVTPQIAITIRMDMNLANFFSDTFVANIALLLQISISRIVIADVRSGSVIVDFGILPNNTTPSSPTNQSSQFTDLETLAVSFSSLGIIY